MSSDKYIATNLGNLATYINGRGFKPSEWKTTGLPIIRIANMTSAKAAYDYHDGLVDNGHYINTGDILVSWSATLDAYEWDRGPAVLNQHIFKVIPNTEVIRPEYLYFVLKQAMHGLSDLVHGATMKHVTRPEFEGFEVQIHADKKRQGCIAAELRAQLTAIEEARSAAEKQLEELTQIVNAVMRQSTSHPDTELVCLGDVLEEVKKGIGAEWDKYPVLGATRNGLALAKDPVGKQPGRYKPVVSGTVFYNPMRIMIGSIAMVDEDDTPGITSPDYVVFRGQQNKVDSRWFYYWLRSSFGEHCISSLARGAVRERMLFTRLAEGKIELPPYEVQKTASKQLAMVKPMKAAIEKQLREIELLPARLLTQVFGDV